MSSKFSSAFLAKLDLLTPDQMAAEHERRSQRKMDSLFPATGPLGRELYAKHLAFFRAGKVHRERLFMAGNRCGKTVAGAYELTLHLTGLYPDWWEGRRFDRAISAWAAGESSRTVRDIVQDELLGPSHAHGTGIIPAHTILRVTSSRGAADAIDSVYVQHARGEVSSLGFKSYKEGRKNFQGTSKHVIWFDEEPSLEVYTEALMRTMNVPGTDEGGHNTSHLHADPGLHRCGGEFSSPRSRVMRPSLPSSGKRHSRRVAVLIDTFVRWRRRAQVILHMGEWPSTPAPKERHPKADAASGKNKPAGTAKK